VSITVAASVGDSSRAQLAAKLSGSRVLALCSRQEIARLLPFLRERRLHPGEALCRAGQPASDLWIVLDGTLRLTRADDSPHDVSDGLVGEEAALGIEHYLADVVAVDYATVAALGAELAPAVLRGDDDRARTFCHSLIQAFAPTTFNTPAAADEPDHRLTLPAAARKLAGWIAAIVAPLLLLRLAADSALPWAQAQLAAALVSTAMLWISGATRPYVASLLVVLVCVTLGVVPTRVVLSGFASNGFFLGLSVFCLGAVLVESGAITRGFLLLMQRCRRSALVYDLAALGAGIVLTPIIPIASDRARVLAPLAIDLAQTLGYERGSGSQQRLLVATFMGLALFSPMFLTGGALNLMLYGALPTQVQDATPGPRWVLAATAAAAVMLAAFAAAYFWFFRRPAAPQEPGPTIAAQLALLGPVRITEWLAVGGVLLFLAAMATVSWHKIDHRLLALAIVCGYLVLGTLGRNQLNLRIDWSALILLGALGGIVATIVYVDLHAVVAGELPGLRDIMRYQPRAFVTLLAAIVVVGSALVPYAGALVGVVAIPLAMVNGMSPWVIVFVILLMTDVWIRPAGSELFRTFRGIARAHGPFDDRLFLRFNIAMVVARVVALAASIVYWEDLLVL
jgi:divalent anion:Na+ symporter, DASS family